MSTSDKCSFLVTRVRKAESGKSLKRQSDAIKEGMQRLKDPAEVKQLAEAEQSGTPLEYLLGDVEDLLGDLGVPVPNTPDQLREEISRRSANPALSKSSSGELLSSLELLRAGRGAELDNEAFQKLVEAASLSAERMFEYQNKLDLLALQGYKSLKAAEHIISGTEALRDALRRDTEAMSKQVRSSPPPDVKLIIACSIMLDDLAAAVQHVSSGASSIARVTRLYDSIDRAKGGRTKQARAKPNPEKELALEYARKHPGLSSQQIKTRANLRASPRTIRGWISASC